MNKRRAHINNHVPMSTADQQRTILRDILTAFYFNLFEEAIHCEFACFAQDAMGRSEWHLGKSNAVDVRGRGRCSLCIRRRVSQFFSARSVVVVVLSSVSLPQSSVVQVRQPVWPEIIGSCQIDS